MGQTGKALIANRGAGVERPDTSLRTNAVAPRAKTRVKP